VSDGDVCDFSISGLEIKQNAYATTWYDQSGEGNDATQTTADNQPKVVDAGVLVTDANGNYVVGRETGVTQYLSMNDLAESILTVFAVNESDAGGYPVASSNASSGAIVGHRTTGEVLLRGSTTSLGLGTHGTGVELLVGLLNGASSQAWIDGVSQGTGTTDAVTNMNSLLNLGTGANSGNVFPSAIIIYPSDQSANRSAIEQLLSNTITTALS